ncbi:MAG: DNA polymerase, partial [Polyangiaceae bacterium]
MEQRLRAQLNGADLRHADQVRAALATVLGVELPNTKPVTLAPFGRMPVVQDLLLYRRLDAFLQQLGWPLLEQYVDSPDGRVRCTFDQLGAVTGRFTTTRPNLLGVPKDSAVRSCFVPRSGNVFVKADYSQIDLRVLAEIAPSPNLIRLFNAHGDVHRQTASRMLGKNPAFIIPDERQGAKPVNFGVCYGMGPPGLMESAMKDYGIALTHAEAEAWIGAFFAEYPGVWQWRQEVARRSPTEVRTLAGRVRYFDGPETKLTEQLATVVQGSAADGFKQAIARLYLPLKKLGARIVLAIHDELLVECPIETVEAVM